VGIRVWEVEGVTSSCRETGEDLGFGRVSSIAARGFYSSLEAAYYHCVAQRAEGTAQAWSATCFGSARAWVGFGPCCSRARANQRASCRASRPRATCSFLVGSGSHRQANTHHHHACTMCM
jgi:hypothetical protein